LYFIVGALVVAVGIFAYFFFADRRGDTSDINVKGDVPKVELQKQIIRRVRPAGCG
jgi:hypothetical protein